LRAEEATFGLRGLSPHENDIDPVRIKIIGSGKELTEQELKNG